MKKKDFLKQRIQNKLILILKYNFRRRMKMKNGKEVTSAKLTVDYIISYVIWGILFLILVAPILSGILASILTIIIGHDISDMNIVITMGVIFMSIIINILVNLIATTSSLCKLDSLDNEKANRYLKNVTIFIIILYIFNCILGITLKDIVIMDFISYVVICLVSLIFMRKRIKNYTKAIMQKQ